VSGSFVLTEAFPAIKLGNKINLIKFRASAGEVEKVLMHMQRIITSLKLILQMVFTNFSFLMGMLFSIKR
jgi:hypothetical protein